MHRWSAWTQNLHDSAGFPCPPFSVGDQIVSLTLSRALVEAHREPRRPEFGLMTESPVAIRYDHQGTAVSISRRCTSSQPILHRMGLFHSGVPQAAGRQAEPNLTAATSVAAVDCKRCHNRDLHLLTETVITPCLPSNSARIPHHVARRGDERRAGCSRTPYGRWTTSASRS